MYVGGEDEKTGIKKDGSEISYADAIAERSKIETKIGLSLAQDSRLTGIAAKITENVGARSYRQLSPPARKKIDGEMDTFGGARAFQEGWGTLGASVFAVMNEIEQDGETKTHYSKVQEGNTENPYFGKPGEKKPEFDEPLASLEWDELPPDAKKALAGDGENVSPFTTLPASTYNELDFKGKLTLLKDFRYKDDREWKPSTGNKTPQIKTARDTINQYKTATKNDREKERQVAITATKKALEKKDLPPETRAILGFRLDVILDKHTSGDHTNLVRRKGDGGVKDQWIEDTVAAGKPIISGPSGHTLRYLNFWAEKRNEENREGGNIDDWPSLEAARLVMMANLMPPKHHSYDEVMTASIGIKDNVSDALKYQHKSSYEDLNKQKGDAEQIAKTAYEKSEAETKAPTNETVENTISTDIEKRKNNQATKTSILKGIESLFINPTTNLEKINAIKEQLGIGGIQE